MDGCSRQNPAYRSATEEPRPRRGSSIWAGALPGFRGTWANEPPVRWLFRPAMAMALAYGGLAAYRGLARLPRPRCLPRPRSLTAASLPTSASLAYRLSAEVGRL